MTPARAQEWDDHRAAFVTWAIQPERAPGNECLVWSYFIEVSPLERHAVRAVRTLLALQEIATEELLSR